MQQSRKDYIMKTIRHISDGKPKLTKQQIARLTPLQNMPEEAIDLSDIPEVNDWSNAKRGLLPCIEKELAEKRLDSDVLTWLVQQDKNTKACVNTVIRQFMAVV